MRALQSTTQVNEESLALWEQKTLEAVNEIENLGYLPSIRNIDIDYGGIAIEIPDIESIEKQIHLSGMGYLIPQGVLHDLIPGPCYIYDIYMTYL